MNKKVMIAVFSIFAVSAVIFSAGSVYANGFGLRDNNFLKSLSSKLGIGEEKIQSALDSMHSEKQSERQKQFEDRLNQAIKDGKITEKQKQLILEKNKELQAKRQAEFEARQKENENLKKWAEANDIDTTYIFGGFWMTRARGEMKNGWMR